MIKTRLTALTIGALLPLGFAATPADATWVPSVTMIKVGNVRVNSGSCREVPVTAYLGWGPNQEIDSVSMQVWRGTHYLDTAELMSDQPADDAPGYFFYCPHLDGLGTFRAGPTEIDYWDTSNYTDHVTNSSTTQRFAVRQASHVPMRVYRYHRWVRVRARARFFSIRSDSWRTHTRGRLVLQKRWLHGHRFVTVARVWVNRRTGLARFPRQYSPLRAHWRVLFHGNRWIWGAKSRTVFK